MKTTLPEVCVDAQLLADLESVLLDGETVAAFVVAAVRRSVELRRAQEAFSARGDDAWSEYSRTGLSYPLEDVLTELRVMTASRRTALGA